MILQGSNSLPCLSSAQWSTPPPVCIAYCGNPPNVRNATVHVTSTIDGGVATYSCMYNYMVLLGNNNLRCLSSGLWSTEPPICKADCGQPPGVANASLYLTSTRDGGVATYTCMYDFMVLQGNNNRTCLSSGNWSGTPPICIADCRQPPVVGNANLLVTSTRDGGFATYSCMYDYLVLQGNSILICLSSGNWSSIPPTCIADCRQPTRVSNASVHVTSTRDGGVATYTCMYAYMVLQGNNNRTCLSSGNWSGTPPICIADCGQPPGVINATVHVTTTRDGGVATYTCMHEYMVLQGNKNLTCLSSGEWSRTTPFCIANCRQPPNVEYANVNVTSTLAGGVAMYACMNDFMMLKGAKNLTCQYSGIWSGREPSCEFPESTAFIVLGSYGNVRNSGHFVSILLKTEAGVTNVFNEHSFTIGYGNFMEQPMSIDIDFYRKIMYIFNKYTGSLQRIEFNPENRTTGATFELLHSGISRSNVKIAVDRISNNLYWTDSEFQWIGLQSLNNMKRHKILIQTNVDMPTGIAVDPIHKITFLYSLRDVTDISTVDDTDQADQNVKWNPLVNKHSLDRKTCFVCNTAFKVLTVLVRRCF
ncbi:hypothetical protein DPMN_171328 [Dreissena polymorpha]|uniref:Sushi domain-containing protein n=1 Tax=Dreissena polymorpha TaxID=45954 RepID=A0A9D4DXU9_DREPO|nr:hypothetical protein DPMN_171328 [Dreissena polymorpha]